MSITANGVRTVVEHSAHQPKLEGSNPAPASEIGRDKTGEKRKNRFYN